MLGEGEETLKELLDTLAAGGALGPVIVGKAFDSWGGYAPGMVELLALPCLVAAGLCLIEC